MTVRAAILQHAMSEDVETNLATALRLLDQAAGKGAHLCVFPEIHLSPFFPKHAGGDASAYLMDPDGVQVAALQEAARRTGLVIIANIYLQSSRGPVDASPVIDADGTLLGCPAMNQIAQFDGFWEEDYYQAGEGFEVFDTAAGLIGVVICFDRHFPESVREVARRGAEIVATPTCNEVGEPLDLFEAEMRTAGYQNHVFTLLANRCGTEEGRAYAGASLITGPDGGVLAKAGSGEAVVTADLDLHRRRALARERAWPQRALKAWG